MTQDKLLPPLSFERLIPQPVERVWAALTRPDLIAKWLMQNDFAARVGHKFTFHARPVPGWSGVTHCEVLELIEHEKLVYSWGDGTESTSGLRTVVTWTLSASGQGTLLRFEQSGFREQDRRGYEGMGSGWPRILEGVAREAAELA
ncbi:MAG TPA: SRPBCC domain-containing protein [Polyangiales bacterium]|nr:SRPBCC domain-containing protein [Polyangiales bacterium]